MQIRDLPERDGKLTRDLRFTFRLIRLSVTAKEPPLGPTKKPEYQVIVKQRSSDLSRQPPPDYDKASRPFNSCD